MSGFSGIVVFDKALENKFKSFLFPNKSQSFFIKRMSVKGNNFSIHWYSNNKFLGDKFLKNNLDVVYGFDGIRLNDNDLEKVKTKKEFINTLISTKGAFSALYIDKSLNEILLFADQTGSHQFFYYWSKRFVAFSSSIFLLLDILRHFNTSINLCLPASYMMLSLGYLLEDFTLVSEIKKVKAGNVVILNKDGAKKQVYHNFFKETAYSKVSVELLKELDDRFKHSIELEYKKDIQYNYEHLSTLSGGLDSRLNVMLAHEYGYKNITALTFSEGMKSDELTAREISSDLSLKHIVLLLNKGFQLYDIETPLLLNNCSVYYFGAAQTLAAVSRVNFYRYGLLHNGGLAESSKGGYLNASGHQPPELQKRYAVSDKLLYKIDGDLILDILSKYPNDEMFVTYNRGFNAIHNGSWMTLPFTEYAYTYMDVDFADLAYSIHPKLRFEGKLTIDWINQLHPKIGNYPWRYGIRPTYNSKLVFAAKVRNKIKHLFFKNLDVSVPFSDWYKKNENLRRFIEINFKQSESWNYMNPVLREDLLALFDNGSVEEKLLCISFLKSIEMIFLKTKNEK